MLLSCPLVTSLGLINPVESVRTQLNVAFIVAGAEPPPVHDVRFSMDTESLRAYKPTRPSAVSAYCIKNPTQKFDGMLSWQAMLPAMLGYGPVEKQLAL